MFYANNEQVKGIFLNGRNYNYLAFGFGKIIPEDRNAIQLNLNLAEKYLNQYRIEYGTVKDGYENALVSPRFDNPDRNGVFHTPFTYYRDGNIIPTKEVDILITNGEDALRNALVYNDMNINGAINYFAINTDFQGHNVNVFPEKDNYQSSPLLDYEMLNNCSNFDLNISTRFSKSGRPTLRDCFNFSGNFKYVGSADSIYLGFRGFLYGCKDGIFNIDCTNMHGGGSGANVRNYYNFSGIQSCSNIKLNITGSSWQVWPHDHSFTSNCNINTYNVISGFGYMNDCNFNVVLPKDSKPEMTSGFEFLNNAENCNYNLYAADVNLSNFRSGRYNASFAKLNNCNLNLFVNNTVEFGDFFGCEFNNCNIVFDNIKGKLTDRIGWWNLYNCNISGNVEAASSKQGFLEGCHNLNVNLNVSKSSHILPMWYCRNVKGNIVAGDMTYITYSSYLDLNVNNGALNLINVEHSLFNSNRTYFHGTNLNNIYARVSNNVSIRLYYTNNTNIYSEGGNVSILGADNCHNLKLSGLTFQTPDSDSLFENIYDSDLKFGTTYPYYRLWHVESCKIDGFPRGFAYVGNCVFRPFNIGQVGLRNSEVGTWYNLWPHRTTAGIRSTDNLSCCGIDASGFINSGDISGGDNLQTSLENHYNNVAVGTSNENSRLTVSCNVLRLELLPTPMPTPIPFVLAGFVDSSISANNIIPLGASSPNAGAKVGTNTRIYCSGYCETPFYSSKIDYHSQNQPVVLLNNYKITNSNMCRLSGGLYCFRTLSNAHYLDIDNGTCVFINNTRLSNVNVNNALLFMGSNASVTGTINVTNRGLVVSKENWTSHASTLWSFVHRRHLCWSIWDFGPWGSRDLWYYCSHV